MIYHRNIYYYSFNNSKRNSLRRCAECKIKRCMLTHDNQLIYCNICNKFICKTCKNLCKNLYKNENYNIYGDICKYCFSKNTKIVFSKIWNLLWFFS
jgi:hypothetical protein